MTRAMPSMAQGYIRDLRRKLRRKSLDRLRANIAEILRLINTPLANIIRDHALLRLPVASLLRFRSVSILWDHLISSPIFIDRLHAKIAEILRLINTPLADIVHDHALPRLLVASILRFRSIYVSWDHIISSPIFTLTHFHYRCSISGVFSFATPSRPLFEPFDPVAHVLPDPSLSFLPSPTIIVRSSSNGLLCCFAPSPLHSYFVCNSDPCGLCGCAVPGMLGLCLARPGLCRAGLGPWAGLFKPGTAPFNGPCHARPVP